MRELRSECAFDPEDELREVGLVKMSVVTQYLKAAGILMSIFVILSIIAMQVSRNGVRFMAGTVELVFETYPNQRT